MVVGVLISKPGITSASTLSIPKDWSPSWFRNLIENQLKGADVRNAVGSGGISVSGNIASPYATIGFKAPVTLPGPVTIDGDFSILNPFNGTVGFSDPHEVKGYRYIGAAPAITTYYPVFRLPSSSLGTFDTVVLRGVFNQSFASSASVLFQLMAGNRNGLTVRFGNPLGQPLSALGSVGLVAYSQTDGSVIFYAWIGSGAFTYTSFDLLCMNDIPAANVWTPSQSLAASTTAPAGTIVWNSDSPPGGLNFNSMVWNSLSLGTGVSNFGAPWQAAQCAMDSQGVVHLRGLIQGSGLVVGGAPGTVGSVPTSLTPSSNQMLSTMGYTNTAKVAISLAINTAGNIWIDGSTGGNPIGWLSINCSYCSY